MGGPEVLAGERGRLLARPVTFVEPPMSGRGQTHEHRSYSRAHRAVTTPTGSVSQHPAAAEEAAGVAVASCGRTSPGTRCVFRRAPATAGLYGAKETARRSEEGRVGEEGRSRGG